MAIRISLDIVSKKSLEERVHGVLMFALIKGIMFATGIKAGIIFALKSRKEKREDMINVAKTVAIIKDIIQKEIAVATDYTVILMQEVCKNIGVVILVQEVCKNISSIYIVMKGAENEI